MAKTFKTKRLLLLVALLLLPTAAVAESDTVGVNSAIKGDVTISSGDQLAKQAVIKDPVFLGDVVNAEQLSSLQLLLVDQTVFTVGPDSSLTINEFVYDPSKKNNSMTASVQKGMFRFMSGGISKTNPADVSVNTPVASMGVRGTIVEGLVGIEAIEIARVAGVLSNDGAADALGATLFILRGPGRNHTSTNRRGEISVTSAGITKTTNESGMAIFVSDINSPPSDPFRLTFIAYKAFQDRLRAGPTQPESFEPFNLGISGAPGLQVVCNSGCDCRLSPVSE